MKILLACLYSIPGNFVSLKLAEKNIFVLTNSRTLTLNVAMS